MISPEMIESSFRAMTDGELVARWARQEFTEDALLIAAGELRTRGIEPSKIDIQREVDRQARDAVAFRKGQRPARNKNWNSVHLDDRCRGA